MFLKDDDTSSSRKRWLLDLVRQPVLAKDLVGFPICDLTFFAAVHIGLAYRAAL